MTRSGLSSFVAFMTLIAQAHADPVKLTGAEIKAAFTSNTVHGTWAGKEYWSYFGGDGWTTYLPAGGNSSDGRWGVDAAQYCSTWAQSGSSCYDIYRDGTRIVWGVPSSGARYESTLLDGDQLPK
ncbi:MAG TPA: hypothetical protein VMW18_08050 [Candidatus Binatia bacterium]|nr:hypothetical protein [Candidatus Binatia bacterium]